MFNSASGQGNYSCGKMADKSFLPGINHIIMYGQSLMLGTSSVPVITHETKYNTLMFEGGIRSGYDTIENIFYRRFAPLTEKAVISKYTGSTLGETPASGFSETMMALLMKEDNTTYKQLEKNPINNHFQLLISSPAQGSSSAEDLTANGPYWERFKKDVTEGFRLASAEGISYNVPVILWNQGEHDIDLHTSPETYKALVKAFQLKADKFIRFVTSQKNTVRIIMYQVASHNVRGAKGEPFIANAQYELAKTEPFITMSNATYQLPYSPDHVHFTNVASKWNGGYHGVAAKRVMIDNIDWRPIFVEKSTIKGKVISLDFHVPSPPLVFDLHTVSDPGNYGFKVLDNNGNEVKITSVKIEKGKTIKITVAKNVMPGFYIWYGNNGSTTGPEAGARGNLRDSQGQKITLNINGTVKRLDNWCPIFREVL